MKKLFIISSILLGVVLFFLGVYNFAFKKDVPMAAQPATQNVPVREPQKTVAPKPQGKISAISDRAVIGAVFDKKTEEVAFYDGVDGTTWRMSGDGTGKRKISDTKLPGLKSVLWSSDLSKVLTRIDSAGKSSFFEYDHVAKRGIQLNGGIDWVAWDNLGVKIFYKYFDAKSGKRSFNIANADGSEWRQLAEIPFLKISIAAVPGTALASYWNFPNADEETQLQTIGSSGGSPQIIFKGRFGGDYLWSPDGSQALVSSLASKESKMTTLGIVTLGGEYHDLNIPTFVSKCVWSLDGKTIYYALPGGIPDGAKMPNDYINNKFVTDDTFWKMDIATGQKDRIINASEIPGKYDSNSLFLSATEDALYFVNKIDGKLYRIAL